MADAKDLAANTAQIQAIIDQLRAAAGPRGATFAGRVMAAQPGGQVNRGVPPGAKELPLDPRLDVMPPPYAAPKGPILPETLQPTPEESEGGDPKPPPKLQLTRETPQSIMGRLPVSAPGEEALMAPVAAMAAGTPYLKALQEVLKGLKGKFPSKILQEIFDRESKLGKPPNPRDVPPLTAEQQEMMRKMGPAATEKAVGISRSAAADKFLEEQSRGKK